MVLFAGFAANASFTVTVEGASAQMGQTAELIAGFALPAEVADALLVKLDQALTAPTTTSACGTLQALINSTEAQRRARKITAAQAEAIITATVQIMVVQGCQ